MSERMSLNMTTDELEMRARVTVAARELREIADEVLAARTSTKAKRHEQARKLSEIAASLLTVELLLVLSKDDDGGSDQQEIARRIVDEHRRLMSEDET